MKENTAINMLKGIAAIMIILIHAPLPGMFGQAIIVYARTGAALFFFTSGYFMFSEKRIMDYKINAIRKANHILKIAVPSYLFYTLYERLLSY